MSLFNGLKRLNVIYVAMAYVVATWLINQVVETILPTFDYGDVAIRHFVIVLAFALSGRGTIAHGRGKGFDHIPVITTEGRRR